MTGSREIISFPNFFYFLFFLLGTVYSLTKLELTPLMFSSSASEYYNLSVFFLHSLSILNNLIHFEDIIRRGPIAFLL